MHKPRSSSFKDILRHYLSDIVYGGNDGIVTTFAVVSGVAGARLSLGAMIIIGVVSLFADGISMASSNYLAIRSQAEAHGISRGSLEPLTHAMATFLAFVTFGAMPLSAFILYPMFSLDPFVLSTLLTGLTLFLLGAVRSSVGIRRWYAAGLENLCIGAIASLVAFYCGHFLAPLVDFHL